MKLAASCLYEGRIEHRRSEVRAHRFSYRVAYLYVDLDELDELDRLPGLAVNRFGLLRWDRSDYLGPTEVPLATAVRTRAAEELGREFTGPVRMLTLVRHLGFVFNPVTFYYLFDAEERLDAVVAEITNTPWRERHTYVLDAGDHGREVAKNFPKAFHVSPFFDMDHEYRWRFGVPGERLWVRMENRRDAELLFEATLSLERRALTGRSLVSSALRHPLLPLVGWAAIHWQALRLWAKRVPSFDHPAKRTP